MLQGLHEPPLPVPDHSAMTFNSHLGELLFPLVRCSAGVLSYCTQRQSKTRRLSGIRFIVTL